MRVLVACEFTGRVRDAFIRRGHDAISCDFLPTESPGPHYQGDVRNILWAGWDLLIAHPPCTYLCTSGNSSFINNPDRWHKRLEAILFVHELLNVDIEKIALENPVGVISTHIRKPDQYIQPYEYGSTESKKTGLWLKNLPLLIPTNIVEPEWFTTTSGKRHSKSAWGGSSKLRSETYPRIANAMAEQWGSSTT